MSPKLRSWKSQMEMEPEERRAAFEKWLFLHAAGVLLADKAGELLVLREDSGNGAVLWQLSRAGALARSWGVCWQILRREDRVARGVLFHPARVRGALAATPSWVLERLAYPRNVSPEAFLAEVGRRWDEGGAIPHEVGLALGYPLKDVLGFMGLVSLPAAGGCGWRIYGDPRPSWRKSRQFLRARERAWSFLGLPPRRGMALSLG